MADDVLDQAPDQQADTLTGAGARSLARSSFRGKDTPSDLSPPPKVTDDASFEAVPMGKDFYDPQGNLRTKPWVASDEASYEAIPEGAEFHDPEGNVRTKPSYENVSFTSQTLYDMAVNDKERQKALERSYPGKVKQMPSGEFFVEDEGTLRKPRKASDPKAGPLQTGALIASSAAPTVLAGVGEIGGGVLGAVGGVPGAFAGAIAGGGVGGALGQGFNDLILQAAGVYDRSGGEEAGELALAGGAGAAGSAIGRAAATAMGGTAAMKQLLPKAAAKWVGAEQGATEQALGLAEKGVQVPPSTWMPGAPHVQNVVEVFDPAFNTSQPLLRSKEQHYENTAKGILETLGVETKPGESIIRPTKGVPTQDAGKAVLARTTAASKAADERMALALEAEKNKLLTGLDPAVSRREGLTQAAEAADRAVHDMLNAGYAEINRAAEEAARLSGAGHNGGELWAAVGARLQAIRRAVQERASLMYRQADELAGDHLPNVEGLPRLAEDFANQLPEEVQRNQPGLVQQLRNMAGMRNPPPGAPGHVSEAGEWIRPPSEPTFGQLHNLRSEIRHNADFYRLNSDIKNGTYKYFANRVDEALRDVASVPELRPAVEQLNRADRFYADEIPIFEANQINSVMRGLKAGEPADPINLKNVVVKEGHTDLTNRVREMVGPNLWAGVQAADVRDIFQAARDFLPDSVDGAAFAREILTRHRNGLLQAVHGPEMSQRLLDQARALATVNGRVPLTVRPGDTISEVIGRARTAQEAAAAAAKADPLKALQTEMAKIEKEHAVKVAQFHSEVARRDPLGKLYDPTTMASEAVEHILSTEDRILAAAGRFGEDSPEFNMIRQVYLQRILRNTVKPTEKLKHISPEVHQVMFPGTTGEQLDQLAKEMDFLVSGKRRGGAGSSMSAFEKVEHPPIGTWRGITKKVPILGPMVFDPINRSVLGLYFETVRKIATSPRTMRYILKGLSGDEASRLRTKKMVQRFIQTGGAVGAGVGEEQFQSFEGTPQPLEAVQ